jgi:hypothetical protein
MSNVAFHVQFASMVDDKFFVMLSLIIQGKEFMKDVNMDTYMAPLIEEL